MNINNRNTNKNNNNSNPMQTYLSSFGPKSTSNNSVKQSSSGSETDVSTSTSTENLSPEERYVLRSGVRQEPQGEETLLSGSGMDSMSLNNTLIIHHNKSMDTSGSHYSSVSPFFYGKRINNNINNNNNNNLNNNIINCNNSNNINLNDNTMNTMSSIPVMSSMQSQLGSHLGTNSKLSSHINNVLIRSKSPPNLQLSSARTSSCESVPTSPNAFNRALLQHFQLTNCPIDNTSELQQPMLTNYLNSLSHNWKGGETTFNNYSDILKNGLHLPPPPEYERQWNNSSPNSVSTSASNSTTPESKSVERLAISRSHPDLSKFDDDLPIKDSFLSGSAVNKYNIIELLNTENSALKSELEHYYKKVLKLQKFELEIQKVHQSHEELMRTSDKKERLERAIRYKLEIDSRRLHEQNRDLKNQLDTALAHLSKRPISDSLDDTELKKEIQKRDVLIAQLLSQNKELLSEKERQEIELQAQRLTLQEQRNHIDILDNALMSAQNNVIKLETECRKKQAYEERANHLQKALCNLQLASDRRLEMEKRVRTHLEKEIESLKKQQQMGGHKGSLGGKPEKDVEDMKKVIRNYEEKIISLEAEVTKWEQRYLEESTLRSIELSSASAPKDAKIAALERTSQESEKLIAEARSERLRHMDELHVANKKNAEFEGRIKDMESKLAEKEAMIKVLRQHSRDKDVVLQKTVMAQRTPNRHARSASTMGLTSGQNSHNPNQSSNGMSTMRTTREDSTQSNSQSNDSQNGSNDTNLDEQLKQLDSRLTNKDSIIRALRSEKERFPNHYNNWRL